MGGGGVILVTLSPIIFFVDTPDTVWFRFDCFKCFDVQQYTLYAGIEHESHLQFYVVCIVYIVAFLFPCLIQIK